MPRQAVVQPEPPEDTRAQDAALRPRWLREVIGQKAVVQRLGIVLNACKKLKEPLSHILFDGPPGLGKTTFASVLPNELGTSIQMTSGPALSKPADMLPFLTNVEEGSILFIDEIHRMPRVVEEFIYPAMEDFRVDIVLGEGVNARTIALKLKRFTLMGATMNLPADTLSDEVEPYLLREQYIVRTPRGRVATARTFGLLGQPMREPPPDQPMLFD